MPLELLSPFIEEFIDWLKQKGKNKKMYHRYLEVCQNNTKALYPQWLPDGGYQLKTLDAFIPVQLRPDDISRSGTVSLKAALKDYQRLVVMGLAGAGKSTLAKYIAALLSYSLDGVETSVMKIRLKRELGLEPLFPIHVDLVACNDVSLEDVLFARACNSLDMEELVKNRMIEGNCFVIFDGLDEIIDSRRRMKVMREIADITNRYGDDNYFMVTTRPAGYNKRAVLGGAAGYRHYYLAEWTDDQQEQFIKRYYKLWSEMGWGNSHPIDWEERALDLIGIIHGNVGLRRLKNNPLMLSIITYLSFQGEVMPKQEYKVYEEIIRYLVDKKAQDDNDEKVTQTLFFVATLAFFMLEQEDREIISRHDLVGWLQKRGDNVDSNSIIEKMEEEWGVIVNVNEHSKGDPRYSFISQSFQVYLAAYAANRHSRFWKRLQQHLKNDYKGWEEVALMYASMSSTDEKILRVDQVIQVILPNAEMIPYQDQISWVKAGRCIARAGEAGKRSRWYEHVLKRLQELSYGNQEVNIQSVEVLCQIHPEGSEFILKRIMGHLAPDNNDYAIWTSLQQMNDSDAKQQLRHVIVEHIKNHSLSDRISLAKALALIGDDRLGRFVSLPHLSNHDRLLRIGMYPVTNFEYAKFIKETSYPPPSHWGSREYPAEKANHPVTHVSQQDAIEYCKWLTENSQLPTRLPSEEEWMYAANAGNSELKFPWESPRIGGVFLNFRGIIGDTTPVGIYFEGESPLGVLDMMGNVWEWTADKRKGKAVLKGGAWDTSREELEEGIGAARMERAEQKENNIGFRILQEYTREVD